MNLSAYTAYFWRWLRYRCRSLCAAAQWQAHWLWGERTALLQRPSEPPQEVEQRLAVGAVRLSARLGYGISASSSPWLAPVIPLHGPRLSPPSPPRLTPPCYELHFLLNQYPLHRAPLFYFEFLPAFHPCASFEIRALEPQRFELIVAIAHARPRAALQSSWSLSALQAIGFVDAAADALAALFKPVRSQAVLLDELRITTLEWGPLHCLDGIDGHGLIQRSPREQWLAAFHTPPLDDHWQAFVALLCDFVDHQTGKDLRVERYLKLLRRYYALPLTNVANP